MPQSKQPTFVHHQANVNPWVLEKVFADRMTFLASNSCRLRKRRWIFEVSSMVVEFPPHILQDHAPACILSDQAPAHILQDHAPAYILSDQAPAHILQDYAPAYILSDQAPAHILQDHAPSCILSDQAPAHILQDHAPACILLDQAPAHILQDHAPACIFPKEAHCSFSSRPCTCSQTCHPLQLTHQQSSIDGIVSCHQVLNFSECDGHNRQR